MFELNQGGHHDHLVCLQCGRVEEFFDAEIEKRQTQIARERGFEISEHALYLYAECTRPRCPYRKAGGRLTGPFRQRCERPIDVSCASGARAG